jgi:hypothetical protein
MYGLVVALRREVVGWFHFHPGCSVDATVIHERIRKCSCGLRADTPSLSQRHQSRIYFVLSLRCPSRALRCTTRLDRSILCWASEKHGSSWQVVGHGGGGGGGGLTGRPLTGASPTCSWWPRTRFTRAVLASVCSGRRQRSREGRLCELCFPASA